MSVLTIATIALIVAIVALFVAVVVAIAIAYKIWHEDYRGNQNYSRQ